MEFICWASVKTIPSEAYKYRLFWYRSPYSRCRKLGPEEPEITTKANTWQCFFITMSRPLQVINRICCMLLYTRWPGKALKRPGA